MKRLFLTGFLLVAIIAVAYGQTQWVADVTLEWGEAQFATSYNVYVSTADNPLMQVYDVGDVTQYKIVGLPAGELYTITVRGVNAFGEGLASDPASADLRQPGKPNNNRIVLIEGRKL